MNPLFAALPTENRAAAAPRLKVTILYECLGTGKRAKGFADRLAAPAEADSPPSLNLWSYGVLGTRAIRNLSASTASVADLVVFSMSGHQPLPAPVEKWVELWTWLIDGHQPAVVALFAAHGAGSTPARAFLERHTAPKGLELFVQPNRIAAQMRHGAEPPVVAAGKAQPAG